MTNPLQSLNESFFYNSMLARALIQLLPDNDRKYMRYWLDKLHDMEGAITEMTIRNDYMWFMLVTLQSKKTTQPFNGPPPPGDLRPLKDILTPELYEEVLNSADQNMSWLEKAGEGEDVPNKPTPEQLSSMPCDFFDNQPIPRDGVICYMAAFSDHDY